MSWQIAPRRTQLKIRARLAPSARDRLAEIRAPLGSLIQLCRRVRRSPTVGVRAAPTAGPPHRTFFTPLGWPPSPPPPGRPWGAPPEGQESTTTGFRPALTWTHELWFVDGDVL